MLSMPVVVAVQRGNYLTHNAILLAYGILQVMSFFARKLCDKRTGLAMHLSGFLAAMVSCVYSTVKLLYWFLGISPGLSCNTVKILAAFLINGSSSIAFVHQYLRANAINSVNNRQKWRYARVIAIALILIHWGTMIGVIVHRGASIVPGIDGPRCKFTYKQSSFLLKWAVQLANHIGQSSFFVWPLISHMRLMEQSKLIGVVSSAGDELYRRLARRGIIAMLVSVVFEGECSTWQRQTLTSNTTA
eukprot:13786-Heterococcus_DN1.PRE.1